MTLTEAMKIRFFVLLIVVAGGFWCWKHFTSPWGEQKVLYEPSLKECFKNKSPEFEYCVHTSKRGHNGGLAYLLHGRNLDAHTWNDDTYYTSLIQNYWEEQKIIPPRVVVVSFGPVWLLSPKGKKTKSGLQEVFLEKVIPLVEARIGRTTSRSVFGESMGGLNALVVGLTDSASFERVAALCPPLYEVSPFDSSDKLFQAIKATGADPKIIYGVIRLAHEFIADKAEWSRVSPLILASESNFIPSTKYYVSAPLYDRYGNFAGAEKLSQLMKQKNFKIQWRPLYGGHCAVDIASVAQFLVE